MADRKFSFPPIVAPDTRLLVLGSLPGERSLAAARYYAHPQNQFWQLLSPAAGRDLAALDYPERLEALRAAAIGLWDVVASATRPGSTDAALRDVEPHDIVALADSLPALRAIAFNGATAYRHGLRQLGAAAARYTVVALPSSSPLHTIGFAAKAPAWAALAAFSRPEQLQTLSNSAP
ncbi:DNA-deoxyinosine glycosylase [Sphingomonas sp. TDK1]|uniref:DNA-deoxyinosine glycosylase n=1 Tax=Sphingomonas sp. TDK1 TaxID=453247 RepID=UPI0007D90FC8|nr:DNA-deoxyinosine glycosylase [Sphingomonas sp. TDK1]OAN57168.1 DNA-deoxyinosine glycosylase [Sphingomonas sp. TDK1]